jgi:hypothetical protein
MKIIEVSVDKHRQLLDYWAVIDSEEDGQFTEDIDSKSRKITMEMALVKIVDGIQVVYFIIWRKKFFWFFGGGIYRDIVMIVIVSRVRGKI